MVHHDDVVQIYPDIGHQLICFGVNRMTVVQLWSGRGDQPQVTPAPLVAAFCGFVDMLEIDVRISMPHALGCFGDDLIAQECQLRHFQLGIFGDQIPGMVEQILSTPYTQDDTNLPPPYKQLVEIPSVLCLERNRLVSTLLDRNQIHLSHLHTWCGQVRGQVPTERHI